MTRRIHGNGQAAHSSRRNQPWLGVGAGAKAWLLALLVLAICLHVSFWIKGDHESLSNDIHDIWMEGHRLSMGIDPYRRILGGDMRHNDDYPAYLPLAYLFSAALHGLGVRTFAGFMALWRPLSLVCHLGIGILIYRSFSIRGHVLLGFCAASLILLGRWSVYLVESSQLEFVAILPLLLAVLLLRDSLEGLG